MALMSFFFFFFVFFLFQIKQKSGGNQKFKQKIIIINIYNKHYTATVVLPFYFNTPPLPGPKKPSLHP